MSNQDTFIDNVVLTPNLADHKENVETSTEGLGNITLSGEQTLNGLLTSSSRVAVIEQTSGADNGIYISNSGAWARSSDANSDSKVTNGMITWVGNAASTKIGDQIFLATPNPIVLGTTSLTFQVVPNVGVPAAHALGGSEHTASTLAALNTKISDGTVVDTGDSRFSDARTPTAHSLGGAEHDADTLANLNLKVSDATLIDTGDSRLSDARTPTVHSLGGAEHSADTLANLNTKVSDATLIDTADSRLSDARTPTAHTHDGDTLQADGINSDGGAFPFDTTGDVTANQDQIISKAVPEHKLTDTVDSNSTRIKRTDVNAAAQRLNTIDKAAGQGSFIDFDGEPTDDEVKFGNVTQLQYDFDEAFSIVFLMRPDNVTSRGVCIGKNNPSAPFNGWNISVGWQGTGTMTFEIIQAAASKQFRASTPTGVFLADGTIYHVAVTYDGSNTFAGIHIYVDGVDQSLTANLDLVMDATISNTNDFGIGAFINEPTVHFNGGLDEIVLYDNERSQAQVTADFNAGAYTNHTAASGIDLILHCNELSGTSLADSSGNGFNSTAFVNSPTFIAPGFVGVPGEDVERSVWKLSDGLVADEAGVLQVGDLDTRHTIEGKTIRFNINGVEKFQVTGAGVFDKVPVLSAGFVGLGPAAGRIVFCDDATDVISFTDANVGIGTASPLAKLAINGGLHVGGDSDPGDNNLLVDGTLEVTGAVTFTNDLTVGNGGTGASSFTDGGILLGSGTGPITATAVLADGEILVGDAVGDPVAESGATARTSLGVAIGSDVQAFGDVLDDFNTLAAATADGEFIVATAAGVFAYESGNTARTSLGLGTGDSPTFTNLTATDVEIDGALNHDGSTAGFYGTAPIAQQTGVAVTDAAIHAALVSLGLITA